MLPVWSVNLRIVNASFKSFPLGSVTGFWFRNILTYFGAFASTPSVSPFFISPCHQRDPCKF